MTQQCEAPNCDQPATTSVDSPEPGGTMYLCRDHAEGEG